MAGCHDAQRAQADKPQHKHTHAPSLGLVKPVGRVAAATANGRLAVEAPFGLVERVSLIRSRASLPPRLQVLQGGAQCVVSLELSI